jgi:hypothetical protein
VEPIGSERTDVLLAHLCAMFFNVNRDKKTDPASWKDFIPHIQPPNVKKKQKQKTNEKIDLTRKIAAMFGQKI